MNILIIQLLRLGDAIQIIPIVHGLKIRFPRARIFVLTSSVGRLVFEKESLIEQVFVLRKELIGPRVRQGRPADLKTALEWMDSDLDPLFAFQWDWVMNFSFSFPSALIAFLLDPSQASGYLITPKRQYFSRDKWFCFSLASFCHRRYSNFNWVDINKSILGLSGVPSQPLLKVDPRLADKARRHLQDIGFHEQKIIGIHPGASVDYKRWPLDKFQLLCRNLVNKHDRRLLIFGDRQETSLCQALQQNLGTKALNLAGRTNMEELCAYLVNCRLLVGNDSGPMHLAAGLGTKTIALYFNSHFIETGPYAAGHVAVHPDLACFPCQGPLKCQTKECLRHIDPGIIEKLVVAQIHPERFAADQLAPSTNTRVYVSAFDPWGMLEWLPLDPGPIAFREIERLLIKSAWLELNRIRTQDSENEENWLLKKLRDSSVPLASGLGHDLDDLAEKAGVLKSMFENAVKQTLGLQTELGNKPADPDRLKPWIDRLAQAENEIGDFGRSTCLAFIAEFAAVLRENLKQQDLLHLAEKTARIYHESTLFLFLLIDRAINIKHDFEKDGLKKNSL